MDFADLVSSLQLEPRSQVDTNVVAQAPDQANQVNDCSGESDRAGGVISYIYSVPCSEIRVNVDKLPFLVIGLFVTRHAMTKRNQLNFLLLMQVHKMINMIDDRILKTMYFRSKLIFCYHILFHEFNRIT